LRRNSASAGLVSIGRSKRRSSRPAIQETFAAKTGGLTPLIESPKVMAELTALRNAAAKEKQLAAGERGKEGGRGKKKNLEANALKVKRAPQARDKVAQATGMDARTLAKAEAAMLVARSPICLRDLDLDAFPPVPLLALGLVK
jgi:hypothetical protein